MMAPCKPAGNSEHDSCMSQNVSKSFIAKYFMIADAVQ